MKAEDYCAINSIPPTLSRIMEHLPQAMWSVFKRHTTQKEDVIEIFTGYYDRSGWKPLRRSYAEGIIKACKKIGFPAIKGYGGQRNCAPNERVAITIIPTSVVKQQENFNK